MTEKLSGSKAKNQKVKATSAVVPLLDATMYGTDIGNGGWDVHVYHDGKLYTDNRPHGRVQVAGKGIDSPIDALEYDWLDWRGSGQEVRYATGEGITSLTSRALESHRNTAGRYGDDMHIMGIVNGLARLNAPTDKGLTVVVPMPPGLMVDPANVKRVKQAIRNGEDGDRSGRWSIRLKGWKNWKTYQIERVITMPEGAPAFAAYAMGLDGKPVEAPYMYNDKGAHYLGGNVTVIDLGYGTGDMFTLVDGRIDDNEIASATDAGAGIQTHVITPVLDKVREQTGAAHLTEAHADSWLRTWAIGGYKKESSVVRVSGKSLEMQDLFQWACHKYADWVSQEMVAKAFRRGADAVLICGGGWLYIENDVRGKNPNRTILAPHLFPHIRHVPVFSLNAYGSLAFLANYLATNG